MFEYFAGCFLLETTVLCSLNFAISLPCPWKEKDGLGKFNPRPFTKRLSVIWWLQRQGGLKCALQGELPAMALPRNQECVVLSLAVLLPRIVPLWVWGLGLVSSGWAGQSQSLGVMPLSLPSLQLHLLPKSSTAPSPPCPTLCQRHKKEKACLIFLTLMKTCKRFPYEEQGSWKMRLDFLLYSTNQNGQCQTGDMYFTQSISALKEPQETWGFLGILLCCIPLGGKEKQFLKDKKPVLQLTMQKSYCSIYSKPAHIMFSQGENSKKQLLMDLGKNWIK